MYQSFLHLVFGLGIGQPLRVSTVVFLLTSFLLCVLVGRLHWRRLQEHAARVRAERLVRLSDRLEELTAAVSKASTSAEVIDSALPVCLYAVEATAGAVVLVSDDGQCGELARAVGYDEPLAASWQRFPLSGGHRLTDTIRRHEIITVESPTTLVESDRVVHARSDVATADQSTLALPLVASGRAVGAYILSFRNSSQRDAADTRQFLQTAARRTTEGLARARQYEVAERARAEAETLRHRADQELREREKVEEALRDSETKYRALAARTSLLHSLSAALAEAVTLDAVAKAIVRHGKTVVGASAGSVVLLVDGGTQLETLYAEGYIRQPVEAWHRFPVEAGLCATNAIQTRQPLFVASFAEWQERYPRSASMAADSGVVSAASLPLIVEEAAIGVLAFHFMAPVNFDDDYRALLVSIAQHCAQAIDRARLYETAQRARGDAEAANRSKDDFLSTVSHELRTPLTAVLGWASMLRKGSLDSVRTTRAVEAICNNARRQAQMIDELLDVSRIVAGRATLDLQSLDLRDSIRGAVEAILPLAEAKSLEVRLGAHPSVPVRADPRRLEQILANLLSNAVKFTAPGGWVAVDVDVSKQSVEVRVADNGSGIDPAFLPQVFERFRQAESSTARSASGLGLGLFIARQLIEAQGGSIRAESGGPGAGATFTVRLPVIADIQRPVIPTDLERSRQPDPSDRVPSLDGIRVLLVDDEADVRELMRVALERYGASVVSVGSAREALTTLARVEVDALLADLAMPGEDGYDLIRKVRALPAGRARIPAAAVTACARDDERQRALAAGFQVHLAKPLEPVQLVHAVANLVSCPLGRREAQMIGELH